MTRWDVVVIGGGPAGSSTALHLVREQGIRPDRVLVLDRARFPREKPCAGAISALGMEVLARLGVPLDAPSVPMCGLRILSPAGVGETRAPLGVAVRRAEFDARLLDAVRGDGVVVRDGEGVVGLERAPGGFRVTTTQGEVDARLLAACDGAGGASRRLLGIPEPARKGHLYVLETAPTGADVATLRGLADFDLCVAEEGIEGYYWDFPAVIAGARAVSRGIYHANLTPSSRVKAALARALAARGVDPDAVELKPFATRPFVRATTCWREGVVLVGEAAGIDRATGEGIAQALDMGSIAARHLARALRTGGACFAAYDVAVRASTSGRHMLQSARLAEVVYSRAGAAARHYLVASDFARRAGVRWYRGERLSLAMEARLGLGLLAHGLRALLLARRPSAER